MHSHSAQIRLIITRTPGKSPLPFVGLDPIFPSKRQARHTPSIPSCITQRIPPDRSHHSNGAVACRAQSSGLVIAIYRTWHPACDNRGKICSHCVSTHRYAYHTGYPTFHPYAGPMISQMPEMTLLPSPLGDTLRIVVAVCLVTSPVALTLISKVHSCETRPVRPSSVRTFRSLTSVILASHMARKPWTFSWENWSRVQGLPLILLISYLRSMAHPSLRRWNHPSRQKHTRSRGRRTPCLRPLQFPH